MVGSGLRTIWVCLMVGALAFSCGGSGEDDGTPGASSGGATPLGGASSSGGSTSSSGGASGLGGGSGTGGGGATAGGAATTGGVGDAGAGTAGGGGDVASGGAAGSAGSGAEAGAGDAGAAGASGRPLQPVGTIPADKIDLLFVIDNSISMADKQTLLRDAVPLLVQRLVTPVCVDAAGTPNGQHARANGSCAAGEPEFPPIRDFHIGVISSSLGSHGGDVCTDSSGSTPNPDDRAQLLPSVRTGLTSWNDSGFLAWDPEGRATPPGANDASAFVQNFQDMVVAAGDGGCGYESTLEAWYRFLVDADPPATVTRNSTLSGVDITAPNAVLLAQRQAFLRPDSLVGIVVLSDENDCSIADEGQAFLTGMTINSGVAYHLPRSTSACATDPNDPCCFSCAVGSAPGGCTPPASDSECQKGTSLTTSEDTLNLRCFDQKRRFGFDFLQPIQRYVDGLSASEVLDRSGQPQKNPLFDAPSGVRPRDASRVFFLAIVGVPWQDVADSASLTDSNHLHYLSTGELEAAGRFALMLAESGALPEDGLMFETSADRSTLGFGPHPLTGDELVPSTSTDPQANAINGHESSIVSADDLQYSCIFPLAAPRDCSNSTFADCDCTSDQAPYGRALCQPPTGGAVSTTQYYAKAYPGLRQIELARRFGRVTNNAVIASICPKVLSAAMPSTSPTYGYNPAVSALVDRMKAALAPSCLATPLPADSNGSIECNVLEVTSGAAGCDCDGTGRGLPSRAADRELRSRLGTSLYCGGPGQPACASLCVCELAEVPSSDLSSCQNDASVAADLAGYCYLDAGRGFGAASLLEPCPVDRKRRLRFVGSDMPRPNSSTYVLCPQ